MRIQTLITGQDLTHPDNYFIILDEKYYGVSIETYLIITAILNIGKENV